MIFLEILTRLLGTRYNQALENRQWAQPVFKW